MKSKVSRYSIALLAVLAVVVIAVLLLRKVPGRKAEAKAQQEEQPSDLKCLRGGPSATTSN